MQPATRIVRQAHARLSGSSHHFLRHVHCHVEAGLLYLDGIVPSYYLKQTAQSMLQSLEGIDRVVNRLRVVNSRGVSSAPTTETLTEQGMGKAPHANFIEPESSETSRENAPVAAEPVGLSTIG